jgi:hypothetical protein
MKINIVNHSLISYRAKGITNVNQYALAEAQDNNLFDENL